MNPAWILNFSIGGLEEIQFKINEAIDNIKFYKIVHEIKQNWLPYEAIVWCWEFCKLDKSA